MLESSKGLNIIGRLTYRSDRANAWVIEAVPAAQVVRTVSKDNGYRDTSEKVNRASERKNPIKECLDLITYFGMMLLPFHLTQLHEHCMRDFT